MRDTVIVIDAPVALQRFLDERDGVIISLCGIGIVFVAAIEIAEGHDGVVVLRLARDELLQPVKRLVLALQPLQAHRELHLGIGAERRCGRHLLIGFDGLVVALHVLVGVAQQRIHHRRVSLESKR